MVNKRSGITLVEILVALGIFSFLAIGTALILINSLRNNAIIWEQLERQNEGRRVVGEVVDVVRRAEYSSVGSYPVASADAYNLVVYANIDDDSLRERVRFFLNTASNTLQMGIIEPAGSPLAYSSSSERIITLARAVVNDDLGQSVFTYFDELYTGSGQPLPSPVSTTQVAVVRVQLELEKDPTATPAPLRVESTVHLRNLKKN